MAPSFFSDGWKLLSAEEHHGRFPDTFWIPDVTERQSLTAGKAVKLLFDIETKEAGAIVDRGVDRMWVVVLAVSEQSDPRYVGVLDSDPGFAENLKPHRGSLVRFGPEHVCDIDQPPEPFLRKHYGHYFGHGVLTGAGVDFCRSEKS